MTKSSNIQIRGNSYSDGIMLGSQNYNVFCILNRRNEIEVGIKILKKPNQVGNEIELSGIPIIRGIYSMSRLLLSTLINIVLHRKIITTVTILSIFLLLRTQCFRNILLSNHFISYSIMIIDITLILGVIILKIMLIMHNLSKKYPIFRFIKNILPMEDIINIFRFHGAEHKIINYFMNNKKINPESLSIEEAKKYPIYTEKCGSVYIYLLILICNIYFFIVFISGYDILLPLLFSPLLLGISYELMLNSKKIRFMIYPALLIQKHVITIEPKPINLEVGLTTLKKLLELEKLYQ